MLNGLSGISRLGISRHDLSGLVLRHVPLTPPPAN